MNSLEALEIIIFRLTSHEEDLELRETDKKAIEIIKQALERLEELEKENKKWREIVGCDLCEALGREILLEENEKLKKENKSIRFNNLQVCNRNKKYIKCIQEILEYAKCELDSIEVVDKIERILIEVLGE